MRVLVACEYSAIVRDAFRAKGHEAWSCDLLPTEGDQAFHIQGNVLDYLDDCWDLMIAHPPCTFLANSGVRWLYEKKGRWSDMVRASSFFNELDNANIAKICIENPIPHKHALIRRYDQIVRPWQFGDNESKAVCLWLKELKPLVLEIKQKPSDVKQSHWRMPPGPDRQKERSRFFPSIARAMAEQWG